MQAGTAPLKPIVEPEGRPNHSLAFWTGIMLFRKERLQQSTLLMHDTRILSKVTRRLQLVLPAGVFVLCGP